MIARVDRGDLPERGHDAGDVFGLDADTAVLDDQLHPVAEFRGDLDRTAGPGEFDGVRQNVEQHLPHPHPVAKERRQGWRGCQPREAHLALQRLRRDQPQRLVDHRFDIDDFFLQFHFPGFVAHHVEDVVDDFEEVRTAEIDIGRVADIGLVADRPEDFRFHQIGKPDDRVERGPQLVAHIGEEIGFRLARRLGLELGGLQLLDGLFELLVAGRQRRGPILHLLFEVVLASASQSRTLPARRRRRQRPRPAQRRAVPVGAM